MANVTRTIGATTGSSSSLAAAITWGQNSANYDRATDDILILSIVDDAELNESNLALTGFTGTPTSAKYVRLEAASGNEAKGKFQKARVRGSTNGQHVFNGCEDFLHVKNIAVKQGSTGASDECWRLSAGCTDVVFEKSYFETNNTSQQDCIYGGNFAVDLVTIFDCVFAHGGSSARCCIHAQNHSGSAAQLWRVEHCTINANSAGYGLGGEDGTSGGSVTVHCWNTIAYDASTADYESNTGSSSVINFVNGNRGDISGDVSSSTEFGTNTNNFDNQTVNATDIAATEILITTVDSDYQLVDGANSANNATGNAVAGSVRDSRIDITVDIAGNARPGTYADRDCGAFEVIVSGGATVVLGVTTSLVLAADLNAPGSLSSTQALSLTIAADLAAQGNIAAAIATALSVAADARASGNVALATNVTLALFADLDAAGALGATTSLALSIAADLRAQGKIEAALALIITVAANISNGATTGIAAAINTLLAMTADVKGSGTLATSQAVILDLAADVKGSGQVAASLPLILSIAAAIDNGNSGDIASAMTVSLALAPALTAPGSLAGTPGLSLSLMAGLSDANATAAAAFSGRHIAPFFN